MGDAGGSAVLSRGPGSVGVGVTSTSPSGQSVNIDQRVQQSNPSSMQGRGGIRISSSASSQLTSQMSAMSVGSTCSSLYHPTAASINQSNQPTAASVLGTPYGLFSHSTQNCSIVPPPLPPPAPPNGLTRPVPLICSNVNVSAATPHPHAHPAPHAPLAPSSHPSSSSLWSSGNGVNTCGGFSYHQAPQPAKIMPGDVNVSPTSSTSSVDSLQTPLNHGSLSSSPSAFSSAIGDFSGPRTQAHFYPSNSPVFQQQQQQQLQHQHQQQQLPTFHPVHLHQIHSSSQQPHVQMTPASLPPSCHPASLDPQNLHQPPTQPQLSTSAPVGRRVRTLYECIGENPAELSFEPNSIIYSVRPSREPGKF